MWITMLETRYGSEDGFFVRAFEAGESYDIADGLARAFMQAGSAVKLRPAAGTPNHKKQEP